MISFLNERPLILKSSKWKLYSILRNKNKKIDSLLKTLEKQYFLPRLSFLIYTNSNYEFKDAYFKKYRYLFLNNDLENKYKIERIIFQNHRENKFSIVIYSRSIH